MGCISVVFGFVLLVITVLLLISGVYLIFNATTMTAFFVGACLTAMGIVLAANIISAIFD